MKRLMHKFNELYDWVYAQYGCLYRAILRIN